MRWIIIARAIGGLLSVIALLALLVADTIMSGVFVDPAYIGIVITLIGALLGVDILAEHAIGLQISVETEEDDDV